MAHFAELDENNIVKQVIVIHNNELLDENGNESETKGTAFCQSLFGGNWVQTSFNTHKGVHEHNKTPLRKNYACPGYLYDPIRDAFIPPKPFPSWTLNEDTCMWQAPIPQSENGGWIWNEENQCWDN